MVNSYLHGLSLTSSQISGIVKFYLQIKKLSAKSFADGTGHAPHYSLRTFCRALSDAAENRCGNVKRSLYEAFCVSFLTQLARSSYPQMEALIRKHILGSTNVKSILKQPIPEPKTGKHIQFEGYWIKSGDQVPSVPENYILTASVRQNLSDLARVVSAGKYPVLLQGETSVGKTSIIQWLAQASGNYSVRVNNHEHTDIQEYIGTYTADDNGKLIFQEGVLVQAMRKGYWIILDELNLAPTEVLEALNRVLSRAFRNRFVELHFDPIPVSELETILSERCAIPLSFCKKMVAIMSELQMRRRASGVFAGKQGYITLRDLFRWAERYHKAGSQTTKFYDWDKHMAEEGYMLLSGKVRQQDECYVIHEVIEKHMKRKINVEQLFSLSVPSDVRCPSAQSILQSSLPDFNHIVWIENMQRLAILVSQALHFGEPVLLVGETGPNLFEWVDGPLVTAMKSGNMFLADEISLADDSVLERLNSVLEPEKTLLLAEKCSSESTQCELIKAEEGFSFIATMNPGGDYGKKELSPALRDRFTEIWCPSTSSEIDMIKIVEHNIKPGLRLCKNESDLSSNFGKNVVEFVNWFTKIKKARNVFSIRDILSWTTFINTVCSSKDTTIKEDIVPLNPVAAYIHGAYLVFIDGIGSDSGIITDDISKLKAECLEFLSDQLSRQSLTIPESFDIFLQGSIIRNEKVFGMRPFFIASGPETPLNTDGIFSFDAPTTNFNVMKVLRALQLNKAILLEGSPGVGKTTLISALSAAAGHKLVRINLSEQTDVSDLFGSDLPVDGGIGGSFSWCDGPFLQALKAGHWIILDELNLASQSVLEGLNACLDHRGEIFIPELGKTFQLQSQKTRLFACQNPLSQGGARKGLPKSFLNRFSQLLKNLHVFGISSRKWEFNLRDIFRWCQLICKKQKNETINPGSFVKLIYADRMQTLTSKKMILDTYEEVFGQEYPLKLSTRHVYVNKEFLQIGNSILPRNSEKERYHSDGCSLRLLHHQLEALESLMLCMEMNWMAILIGHEATGKSSIVQILKELTCRPLDIMTLNSNMDTSDLLGGFEQAINTGTFFIQTK
ncbi:Midasin [Nymphon striatum]|nr:Midasin [Nymphon striatum]